MQDDIRSKSAATAIEQENILGDQAAAVLPQPVDYGLRYYDLSPDDQNDLPRNDWGLTMAKFKEGKSRTESFVNILFWVCTVIFLGYFVLNRDMHRGDERLAISLGLGLTWFLSALLLGFLPDAIVAYKQRHPSTDLLAYRQAVCRHKLYVAAAHKAEQAAREAEQALLRQKRSYWERLNGYEFEIEAAEVLKLYLFNPIVTKGSADGGVDIEVARAGRRGVVQCKAHVACVGPHIVRDLFGVMNHSRADFGMIVSRGGFSKGASDFAKDKPIFLVDTADLIAMQEGKDVLAEGFSHTVVG